MPRPLRDGLLDAAGAGLVPAPWLLHYVRVGAVRTVASFVISASAEVLEALPGIGPPQAPWHRG